MPKARKKQPRAASSYRAARRNDCLRGEVKSTWLGARTMVDHAGEPILRRGRDRRSNKPSNDYRNEPAYGYGTSRCKRARRSA